MQGRSRGGGQAAAPNLTSWLRCASLLNRLSTSTEATCHKVHVYIDCYRLKTAVILSKKQADKRYCIILSPVFTSILITDTFGVCSGVTRVGITRGGNWGCHPYFSEKKLATFFALSLSLLLIYYSLEGVTHTSFLPVLPRLSTILCKFAHKKIFPSGVTPWRVSPGAVRPLTPPSDATGCLCANATANTLWTTSLFISLAPVRQNTPALQQQFIMLFALGPDHLAT